MRRNPLLMAAVLFLALGAVRAAAQSVHIKDLAAGKFLVAKRGLGDPNFARTVILLVRYDEDSVLGLIVNRRTAIPLSRAFPEISEDHKDRSDPMYSGGPVEKSVILGLVRTAAKPEISERVLDEVSMISGKKILDKMLAAGTESSIFRAYLGYSGWTRRQLQGEVELGGWYILPGDAASVFESNPEALWPRLILKTEERIASRPALLPRHDLKLRHHL
ncbi:MAG: YqgE/AlgH family protein [Bryobacteraceae bacterium]